MKALPSPRDNHLKSEAETATHLETELYEALTD